MALNFFQGRDRAPSDTQPGRHERAAEPASTGPKDTPRPRSRRGGRSRSGGEARAADRPEARTPEPADEGGKPRTSRRRRSGTEKAESHEPRTTSTRTSAPAALAVQRAPAPVIDAAIAELTRSIQEQTRQLERLIALHEATTNGGSPAAAALPRVGVFVDAANIELSADRIGRRIDWGKALAILTRGRRLVHALAYCPTHDDPGVSIETQRFVEPFLDHGFKIVTKPLKRFADGTIKANVDIELALDLLEMCNRLDVVCLASGDGDFAHLVEVVQAKGVRVEVVGVHQTVAIQLRRAADAIIDLSPALIGR